MVKTQKITNFTSLGTAWRPDIRPNTEELISSDLTSLNRQLFLICVEGRKRALLLSTRLLSLDNTSKNKLWIYNQLQIFGAIPNELKDQLYLMNRMLLIGRMHLF